jgi:hypothetical protein
MQQRHITTLTPTFKKGMISDSDPSKRLCFNLDIFDTLNASHLPTYLMR